jgi:hypothetical protein
MKSIQDFLQQIVSNFNFNQSYIGVIIIAIAIIVVLLSTSYLFVKKQKTQIMIKMILNFFITSGLIIIYSLLNSLNQKITTIDTINLGTDLIFKNLDLKVVLLAVIVFFILYELIYLKQYFFNISSDVNKDK